MIGKIKKTLKRFTRPKYYGNSIEASYSTGFLRKILGISVYTVKTSVNGQIFAKFTYVGFFAFLCWYLMYFFCAYKIFISDQTILRSLYNTKLGRYGDEVERVVTTIYVIYTMWKLPFDVNIDIHYMQLLVNIDKAIEQMGEPLTFSKYARSSYVTVIFIVFMCALGALITRLSLSNLNAPIPLEKVFQEMYCGAMALGTTARYCGYLYLLISKYKILNKVIASLDAPKTRNILIAVRGKNGRRTSNTSQSHDEYTSERLRRCGKVYGMLYDATETANGMFGLCLALTMLMNYILIVLHFFYFMEATAASLFQDIQRYVNFTLYVFWQIGFALSVIYLNIYFSENTMREAKITSYVTHNIINSDVNPLVRTEAVHFSLQIMHQRPVFTLWGLCRINYMLLLEGARTMITFLVIILQFAAE